MKTIITIWFYLICHVSAYTGERIAPVAVQVIDESGKPISGALVAITKSTLKEMARLQGDSQLGRLAKVALGTAKTDSVGYALRYCGMISETNGEEGDHLYALFGEIAVTAKGYQTVKQPFRRSFDTTVDDVKGRILIITIVLKKQAEQDGTGQPATRPESKSEGGDKPQPEAEGRSR